jgi:hypothetical protein
MARNILIAGAIAALAAPTLAIAQPPPGCVQSNAQTSATGTVLGALGGALIGSAIAGRHDRGVGAVGGAVAGGVAGDVLASQYNQPCPQGYYRPAPPPPPPPGPEGFWRSAPGGIHERIDYLQHRIDEAQADGYLGRREAGDAYRTLADIRNQERNLRYRDGGDLYPQDRAYLQGRLDELSRRIRWQSRD